MIIVNCWYESKPDELPKSLLYLVETEPLIVNWLKLSDNSPNGRLNRDIGFDHSNKLPQLKSSSDIVLNFMSVAAVVINSYRPNHRQLKNLVLFANEDSIAEQETLSDYDLLLNDQMPSLELELRFSRYVQALLERPRATGTVAVRTRGIKLTQTEQKFLKYLEYKQGEFLSRQEILQQLRISNNSFDVKLHTLRKKLADADITGLIQSKKHFGYQLNLSEPNSSK